MTNELSRNIWDDAREMYSTYKTLTDGRSTRYRARTASAIITSNIGVRFVEASALIVSDIGVGIVEASRRLYPDEAWEEMNEYANSGEWPESDDSTRD